MIIDLLAAILICYAFYRGYSKGLINTVVDVLSILVGLIVALKFSPLLIDYLQEMVNINPAFEFIIGFLIVFFVVMLLLRFIAERIEDLLRTVKLNFINQLAGGVILGLIVAFFFGGLLVLLSNLKILSESYVAQSTLYDHLVSISQDGGWIFDKSKELFSEFWQKFTATLDQVKDKID
jgi:membrane protein required for colicin V production